MISIPKSEFATLSEYISVLKDSGVRFTTAASLYLVGGLEVIVAGKTVHYDADGNYCGRIVRGDIQP